MGTTKEAIIKRLNKEEKKMKTNKYIDQVTIIKKNIFFVKLRLHSNTTITFEVSGFYPFRPPKLCTFDKSVYFHKCDDYVLAKLRSRVPNVKRDCMCYLSSLCDRNWNPTKNLEIIIEEWRSNSTYLSLCHKLYLIYSLSNIPKHIKRIVASFIQ